MLRIRTSIGSKLAAATRRAVVAFEADEFDPELRTGWSVTAVGHARAVTDPAEINRLAALPLITWAPGSRDHYIVVEAEQVSGRRIVGPRLNGAACCGHSQHDRQRGGRRSLTHSHESLKPKHHRRDRPASATRRIAFKEERSGTGLGQ